MLSSIGGEKSDFHQRCSIIGEKDSLLLQVFSSISLEGVAFLCIIEEREQF